MATRAELKAQAEALAAKIKASLVPDNETGNITETKAGDAYFTNLPENLTAEAVEAKESYDRLFIVGSGIAISQLAGDALANNANLETAGGSLKLGNTGTVSHDVARKTSNRNPRTGEEVVSHGVMKTTVDTTGTVPGLKNLREEVKNTIGAVLASDAK